MRPWLSWIEHLTTNQGVSGSNPFGRTTLKSRGIIAYMAVIPFFYLCFQSFFGIRIMSLCADVFPNSPVYLQYGLFVIVHGANGARLVLLEAEAFARFHDFIMSLPLKTKLNKSVNNANLIGL